MTIHQSYTIQDPTRSNWGISKNSTTKSPWPQTNTLKWHYKLKCMEQQPKNTTPKHLSTNDFLLNQLLLPAISLSRILDVMGSLLLSQEMSRGKIQKYRLKFKQLFSSKLHNGWGENHFFQKYISQNAIVKTKCPTRKKS